MSAWTGHREESFRFDLLDLNDRLVHTLDGVRPDGGVEFNIHATIRGSGNIGLSFSGAPDIDWLKSMVRVSYVIGETVVPLLTGIPRAPVEAHTGTGASVDVELYDKTMILSEDAYGATYGVAAGANILAAVATIILSSGVAPESLLLTPSAATLANALVWEAGTDKLRIVNDLLDAAGYFALYVDGYGRFKADPYTTPASRGVSWSFIDDEDGVYLPEWTFDADTFAVPNRYVCVGRSEGDVPALVATATDEDPASPFSYPSRGRWITRTDTDVEASSGTVLQLLADRRLSDAQQVNATVELTHAWLPIGLNHVVTFANANMPAPLRAVVTKQTVKLSTGGLVTSTLRRIT